MTDPRWAVVEQVFEDEACPHDCPHLKCWDEHHPYGMGTAVERLCECTLNEARASRPDDCPMFKEPENDAV